MPPVVKNSQLHRFSDKALHTLARATNITTGELEDVSSHEGQVLTLDYYSSISLGLISGHARFGGIGRRSGLTTGIVEDVANNTIDLGGATGQAGSIYYPNQTTGEQLTLVSSSAQDGVAGTGALTVKIHYLDNSGVYLHEIVTMNGVTPVNTTATNIRFVQSITVETSGTFGGGAAGAITCYRTGDATRIYARIDAGDGASQNSARMVPAGYTFWLRSAVASAASGKPLSARITATCDHAGIYTPGVFQFVQNLEIQDSGVQLDFPLPQKIPSLAIVKGSVVSAQAGGQVSISYNGWLEQ